MLILAQLVDSLDLARADIGIKNLEVTFDSTGHCTFDFVVPHTFEIDCDQGDYSDDAIVARSGINRICLSGVVDPRRRAESDWLFFLYPGKVGSDFLYVTFYIAPRGVYRLLRICAHFIYVQFRICSTELILIWLLIRPW